MNKEKLNLVAVETEECKIYLSDHRSCGDKWNNYELDDYLFDGIEPSKTFDQNWVCLDKPPTKITKMINQPNINHRFELTDKSLISDKIPHLLKREDVVLNGEDDYYWKEEYAKYKSLYVEMFDKQEPIEEEYEFNLDIVIKTKKVSDPVNMSYIVPKTEWSSDGMTTITSKDVKHQLVDKMMFPSILLPQRPCKLTSTQTYKIVSQYIKDNINPQVAKITSDYDFCFTVKRRIKLAEIVKYTVDVNNGIFQKRKRKPKYVNRQQTEKEETCFSMGHSGHPYDGHESIKGFEASNQEELKEKIDNYCKELINFINAKFEECKHCKGNGVVWSETKPERKETKE